MWFKQLSFYRLNEDALDVARWDEALQKAGFVSVQGLDWFSEGFVPPYRFAADLWLCGSGQSHALALKREERVLPAAVVRDALAERVAQIEAKEGRSVGKREQRELKAQLTDDLLPRAFTRSSRTLAVLDTQNGLLLVQQASAARSEHFLSKLREALGGLAVSLPEAVESPATLMGKWLLRGEAEGGFVLGDECELRGVGDVAAVVRMRKQDLTAPEVVQHLERGKVVSQLGLIWRDRVAFVLGADWTLKRIRYLDVLEEEVAQVGDDEASVALASQLLGTQALSALVGELAVILGGWRD